MANIRLLCDNVFTMNHIADLTCDSTEHLFSAMAFEVGISFTPSLSIPPSLQYSSITCISDSCSEAEGPILFVLPKSSGLLINESIRV